MLYIITKILHLHNPFPNPDSTQRWAEHEKKSTVPAAPTLQKQCFLVRLQGLEPWTNRLRAVSYTHLIKQTKETLEMTPADRSEIIDECTKRIAVYEEFAPKMLNEEEIREVIAGVLKELEIEAPTGKDKGKIMKVLMPKVKGLSLIHI